MFFRKIMKQNMTQEPIVYQTGTYVKLINNRESDFPDFINILFRPFTGKAPSQQVHRSPDNDDFAHRLHRWKV